MLFFNCISLGFRSGLSFCVHTELLSVIGEWHRGTESWGKAACPVWCADKHSFTFEVFISCGRLSCASLDLRLFSLYNVLPRHELPLFFRARILLPPWELINDVARPTLSLTFTSDEQVTDCPFRRCVGTMLSRLFHGSFYSAFTEFLTAFCT